VGARLSDEVVRRTRAAMVTMADLGGQGVLVPGPFVLTAAHCVQWDGRGQMALDEPFYSRIRTAGGRECELQVAAVEPVADVAVLDAAYDPRSDRESEAPTYRACMHGTPPVPVFDGPAEDGMEFPVWVFAPAGDLIQATARVLEDGPTLWVEAPRLIRGGTSGGPVVNAEGELVAVVSNVHMRGADEAAVADEPCHGSHPFLCRALPVWVLRQIRDAGPGD
jgi:hypothetical protein